LITSIENNIKMHFDYIKSFFFFIIRTYTKTFLDGKSKTSKEFRKELFIKN
jgi:hypothetical protein